jgi:transcriptional regulator with PAS, ATPase and Fis domain
MSDAIRSIAFESGARSDEVADRATSPDNETNAVSEYERLMEWRKQYAPNILGIDPRLQNLFAMMERVSDTDCSVLITGESGTGKELVARALHAASRRRDQPFVAINCASIPENLLESELFGHAKGAFTGALNARIGKFVAADGGTLLLDEIGELPPLMQAKLLRVLQDREVTPIGENKAKRIDVRVIAATNRNLEELVKENRFREDLLYRIQVIPLELPPLRERRRDIDELVGKFIERSSRLRKRPMPTIAIEAMAALRNYNWPGNIRELENVIERVVLLRANGEIVLDDLPAKIRSVIGATVTKLFEPMLPDEGIDLRDAVEQFENALILQALKRTGWNKNRASTVLRINRTTLVEKLKKKNLIDKAA